MSDETPVTAKILAVDDDRRNLMAVEAMLQAPGIELVLADSGEAALRRLLTEDFAVILLDVQMPRIDGYEVAAMIRSRSRSSRTPIIFLTAYNKDELHVFRGYTAGAVDYVFKPIEPLILKSKVDVFVDLYRKTEEIRRKGEEERRLLLENLRVRGEKLQAEQELRRRDEHQTLVLRSLPIALYTASIEEEQHQLRFTNESVEAITGYSPTHFLAEPGFWEARLHADDRERVLKTLGRIGNIGSVTLEYRWRCADDTERHLLDQAVLIRDEKGMPREIFGMWFDITERKQLEQGLLHASKLEAIGRLTGGIAHDFNNMLSIVIGNLDLLSRSLDGNDKAKRRVRMAIEGAQRCADLTNRLLAFSRRQPTAASVVDLTDRLPGMLELLRRTLGEHIAVEFKTEERLWPVRVDLSQLEAAIVNLAVNARDAMPGGGQLQVEMTNRVLEEVQARAGAPFHGDFVVISVTDSGTGMPAHVLERVFEPFFTTKESGKGTGLGLSMVYGFVQQSGGHIDIDSVLDQGTSIRIYLPRVVAEAPGDPLAPAASEGSSEAGGTETILVVEDEADVRQVTVGTLEALGYRIREACTADEAFAALEDDSNVDLLLSDIRMPGKMTGVDLARAVSGHWPAIKILLISGYVEAEEQIASFSLMDKPFRAADLARTIRGLLDDKEASHRAPEIAPAREVA